MQQSPVKPDDDNSQRRKKNKNAGPPSDEAIAEERLSQDPQDDDANDQGGEPGNEGADNSEPEPEPEAPNVRVMLLNEQSERIFKATGVRLEVLELVDFGSAISTMMPRYTPPEIELLAMRYAKAVKENEAAQKDALEDLARQQDLQAEAQARIEEDIKIQEEWAENQKKKLKEAADAGAVVQGDTPPPAEEDNSNDNDDD